MVFPPSAPFTVKFEDLIGVGEVIAHSKPTEAAGAGVKLQTNTIGLEACQFEEDEPPKTEEKPKESKIFLKYYQDQKILGTKELEEVYEKMKERLPLSFRISCLE